MLTKYLLGLVTHIKIDAKGVDVENNVDIESTSSENSDGFVEIPP